MANEIQIAPSLDEIKVEGNTIKTSFQDMNIEYVLEESVIGVFTDEFLTKQMQIAIALSSRLWQLPWAFNQCGILGTCFVNGKEIDYPKE